MKFLTALSLSIAGLAGLATFLAVGPLSGVFFIWAATISWATYFALGGDSDAANNTAICGVFGIFMVWYAGVLIADISPTAVLGFPLMAAIIVTVTVAAMCLAANIKFFATIPASVLGYSATFAYLLQTPDKLQKEFLTGHSWDNPLIIISVSFLVGIGFAIASNKLATSLTTVSDD